MYYSDKYPTIPYGIVNKAICGCGLSSFALENNDPLVLVVPSVSMIQNKVAQYPNSRRNDTIFGIYYGSDDRLDELASYIESTLSPKIMVTYDSFYKVIPYIDDSYHIVVDEFTELLEAYGYRDKAINSLLRSVEHRSKLSFISATPITKEYLPEQLQNIPYTELDWGMDKVPVKVIPTQTTKPLNAVLNIIKKYQANLIVIGEQKSEAAYFYINSINLIKQIINKAKLIPSEVRVICSNTPANQKTLGNFKIQTTLDPEKIFNFITSTSFKGCDIYSDNGIAYVISNHQNINTLVSLDISVFQIAGRIRTPTNPFKNLVFHIFNENPLALTQEDFLKIKLDKIKVSNDWLDVYRASTESQQESLVKLSSLEEQSYISFSDEIKPYFDPLKLQLEERVYKDIIQVYQHGLNVSNFYNSSTNFEVKDITILEKYLTTNNFRQTCEDLCAGKRDINTCTKEYPLLADAIPVIGLEGIKRLAYSPTKIRNELTNIAAKTRITSTIEEKLVNNTFYQTMDIKEILQQVYDELGLVKKAKSTDIVEYLPSSKYMFKKVNKKTISGYEIVL